MRSWGWQLFHFVLDTLLWNPQLEMIKNNNKVFQLLESAHANSWIDATERVVIPVGKGRRWVALREEQKRWDVCYWIWWWLRGDAEMTLSPPRRDTSLTRALHFLKHFGQCLRPVQWSCKISVGCQMLVKKRRKKGPVTHPDISGFKQP